MLDETAGLDLLQESLRRLGQGFDQLPHHQEEIDWDKMRPVLLEVAERMHDNYPYFHPLYAGQMLQPPHPIARLAYALAQFINPNNHALDGGRASSHLEKEAVAELAAMFGWTAHLGHLTSGGTFANLEALWVAHRLAPGKRVLASSQAHYTHERICGVLQVPFGAVSVDSTGHLDLAALETELAREDVGTVVATMGTTSLGAVDPLPGILDLKKRYGFRIHADAAYGGYYRLASQLGPGAHEAFARIAEVDSIVVDPHKHGLQPYGCGCILFKDPTVGKLYSHESPYTYFSSSELHLGEISLECSRAGAAAVALWATQRLMPLLPGAEMARRLDGCLAAARGLHARLSASPHWKTFFAPDLDIVVWAPAQSSSTRVSERSQRVFERAAELELHLALTTVPRALIEPHWPDVSWDGDRVTCLRSCLMKPEHRSWLEAIWSRLEHALQTSG